MNAAEVIVERLLTLPRAGDMLPGGLTISRVEDLRKKIAGAVWDYLVVAKGGSAGRYVVFMRASGEHSGVIPVPSNVQL